MKYRWVMLGWLFIVANTLSAQNPEQSWGLNAGLYENELNEIAVSYGISNRTIIMFFADLGYANQSSDIDTKTPFLATATEKHESLSALFGPEIRGYFRTGRVAPFGGVRAAAGWNFDQQDAPNGDWSKTRQLQINLGATYGVEYFFQKSFSAYICLNLINYSLLRTVSENYAQISGIKIEDTTKTHRIRFSQNPAIFIKIYF
jgi:hypothetical protein